MNILQARRHRHVLKTCLISCIHQRMETLLVISALLMLLFTSSESTMYIVSLVCVGVYNPQHWLVHGILSGVHILRPDFARR